MFPFANLNLAAPPSVITAAMYSALAAYDINSAQSFLQLYREPADQDMRVQIVEANRFWRMQLGELGVSTIAVRECLVDDCNPYDWMRLFANTVAHVAVCHGLPREQAPITMDQFLSVF